MSARPSVFVSVGTDHHPFERMVEAADAIARAHPDVDVLVQHGASPAPAVARGVAYLGREDQAAAMSAATVVVSHGGPATIADARATGRKPLVMPRDGDRGEHVDRHQVQYARHCGAEGLVVLCEEVPDVIRAVAAALGAPESLVLGAPDGGPAAAAALTTTLLQRLAGDRVPVLYVAGLGRSGTTLLDRLLGQLPEVCSAGELVFLWERGLVRNERCGCGEHFLACPFWRDVGQTAFGGWENVDAGRVISLRRAVDRNRYLPFLASGFAAPRSFRAARRELLDVYLDPLYRAIRSVSGCLVVVDSSKHTSYAYLLRSLWSVDLRVVHMVRRGEGVAYSWRKEVARPEVDGAGTMPRYSARKSAALWTTHNALLQGLPALGVPTTVLRYEDLVADPTAGVRGALALADLVPQGDELAFLHDGGADLGSNHTVAGNPMRFTTGRISIRADDAWRTSLPEVDRRVVRALTLPLRGRFGYSDH